MACVLSAAGAKDRERIKGQNQLRIQIDYTLGKRVASLALYIVNSKIKVQIFLTFPLIVSFVVFFV